MLGHELMLNALLAGTAVGAACGLAGYLLVLRAEVFAGDALGHVAFTGALAAAAIGIDARIGLFAATVLVAAGMAGLGERAGTDDVTIGTVFAWVLGLGVLCLAIFTTQRSAGNGAAAVRVLFGSIFGLTRNDVWLAIGVGAFAAALLLALARPLLFASLDPDVAAAHGVPVRIVGIAFLTVLGAIAAETTQAVGALLLLGLLAAPAAAAHLLAHDPYRGLALSTGFAVLAVWAGLTLAYLEPQLPPSTAIISVATALYAGVAAFDASSRLRRSQPA